MHAHRFGLFRVRSPLLAESLLVFSSSAYLDVSVQRVCDYSIDLQSIRFPHSDTYGSIGRLHLPVHFRSLPRPSSPPGAKASPMRPYSLPILVQTACAAKHALITIHPKLTHPSQNHPSRCLSTCILLSSPSLVNELFDPFSPVSNATQANESAQYSRKGSTATNQVSILNPNLCQDAPTGLSQIVSKIYSIPLKKWRITDSNR